MSDLQKEYRCLSEQKLTTFDEDSGHYQLNPQRSCFVRCDECINLSEADCYNDINGEWVWCKECLFCIQRAIDLLGFFEHGKPPILSIHDTPKKRERSNPNDFISVLRESAQLIADSEHNDEDEEE